MLETKDLIIKKAEPGDWYDIYHNLWKHEESARHMLWNVSRTEEQAQIRIQKTIAYQKEAPFSYFFMKKRADRPSVLRAWRRLRPVCMRTPALPSGRLSYEKGTAVKF